MNLSRHLRRGINRKIIKFFLENPSSIDTSRSIAIWINEDEEKTEKVLNDLVKAKVLVPYGDNATPAYGYTTDRYILTKIKSYLKKNKIKKSRKRH